MRFKILALVFFAAAFSLAACGSQGATTASPTASASATASATGTPVATATGSPSATQAAGALPIASVPWTDGEKDSYQWLEKSGKQIGTEQVSLTKAGDVWTQEVVDDISGTKQDAKVRVDAKTLQPLGEDKTISSSQGNVELHTEYKDGKITATAVVNGENKQGSTDLPADYIDNDQLLMTLRGIDFKQGQEVKFTLVVGATLQKLATTVTVVGKETVQTPAGSFETWKTEMDFAGQAKQTAWYQVDAPHYLVQYDNGQTKLVLAQKPS